MSGVYFGLILLGKSLPDIIAGVIIGLVICLVATGITRIVSVFLANFICIVGVLWIVLCGLFSLLVLINPSILQAINDAMRVWESAL